MTGNSGSTQLSLITPDWDVPNWVDAYTTTRKGGVSQPPYDSLNVGMHVKDNPEHVKANRNMLPTKQPIHWLHQTHSNKIVEAGSAEAHADASFTSRDDVACAVMTADCIPILISSVQGDCVSAIHAGWRGLVNSIIDSSLAALPRPANELVAWIGPCISQPHFEVGQEVAKQFKSYSNAISQGQQQGKYHIDMALVAALQLRSLGVQHVYQSQLCTYANEDLFFSHRRATHQGLSDCGRVATVIALT
ncbi:peptidoglycan editing factor PgeF [Aestuariibacter sp. AA17]|uniref:Purine nucleoside phosphorylase n=1 Tax=Fluctibacter corallii TaxID=2984329 RepID=A0ABT3A3D0_9ALTE|nr:peptidoglycan editing factor PgeF [Aestuariibacter sp. AA17]MCV2883195.1 peptidoglycan editing factor PgeF [Aestuariibacter sp. AA17]